MTIDLKTVESILPIAREAGKAILEIYQSPDTVQVTIKKDNSPVTMADYASHTIITKQLLQLYPNIPILSEEGKDIPYNTRKDWEYYWCVDPLDGTKEFIHKRDEFTVNIALVHNRKSVLGVIYVPVTDTIYYGLSGIGSWKIEGTAAPSAIHTDNRADNWTAIGSRSHATTGEQQLLTRYPVSRLISAGSSLKFCRIAEGAAHIYYREGPTMEWDTAAGQAIAESSGATMTHPDGTPFLYNKEQLLNSSFICKSK